MSLKLWSRVFPAAQIGVAAALCNAESGPNYITTVPVGGNNLLVNCYYGPFPMVP